jgi:hypothetical protein
MPSDGGQGRGDRRGGYAIADRPQPTGRRLQRSPHRSCLEARSVCFGLRLMLECGRGAQVYRVRGMVFTRQGN